MESGPAAYFEVQLRGPTLSNTNLHAKMRLVGVQAGYASTASFCGGAAKNPIRSNCSNTDEGCDNEGFQRLVRAWQIYQIGFDHDQAFHGS